MKIVCTKENLKRALNLTSKTTGSSATLPILNNLLLKTESGQLGISSTNLEIAIKTWVGGQISESGEITVPAKTITDFVNNLTEEKITLETKKSDLLLKTNSTESLLKGLPAEEFPLIPEIKPITTITLPAAELTNALSQVVFATAVSETQPEISGVYFHLAGKELCLAATDRYRLAERKVALAELVNQEQKIIVPSRAISEVIRIAAAEPKTVEILISENQVLFRTPNVELTSRLIEGQYVPYREIIPNEFLTTATSKTTEFISALKISGLFAQENNNVDLEITKEQTIVFRTASQKYGTSTSQLKALVEGESNRIVFNYRYILDCLNHIGSDEVVLKAINSSSPAMLIPKDRTGYLYLVMPIKT